MKKKSNSYYKQFIYRVEKKISVEDFPKIKDYAKQGVYLYVIHDTQDNNRFLFLSSQHYEEETKISPETFIFTRISGTNESIHLKFKYSRFNILFFAISDEKADFSIVFRDIISGKTKDNKMFKKFKTHTKKIALDNPDWYLEFILNNKCKSHKKKIMQLLLCKNSYNSEIINHSISSFFILDNPDFMKFNDHSLVLDEGKTGKSSVIGYMGEKLDNISVAGLYGSSDSKRGKFKGGIITTTEKSILIDEVNELMKNNKGEKVLSVLNSLLENGTYNYQKQFGQKIRSANQFFFMGNIGEELNFPLILLGIFGNVETIGRRVGIITYNSNLSGFEKGLIRPENPNPYLGAISIYLSSIFNQIIQNPKYVEKLYSHKKYKQLCDIYHAEISEMCSKIEEPTTIQFLNSHKDSVDRIVTRALKLWIFNNVDDLISGDKKYDNHSLYEILIETEKHINSNISNLKNIKEHVTDYSITDRTEEVNKREYEKVPKTFQLLLKIFWENKENISQVGVLSTQLRNKGSIKHSIYNYRRRGIPETHKLFLQDYGLNVDKKSEDISFRIINKKRFMSKIKGVFESPETKVVNVKEIENAWNKGDSIEENKED